MAFSADYEIVERSAIINVESKSFVSERHREVVRILSQKGSGYREYISVNSYIQVRNVAVQVHYPDGRLETMKDEEILEIPITQSAQMITDLKALVIAPRSLVRGCTVTIEYDRSATSLLYIDPWIYMTSVPIRKASAVLKFPASVPIKYRGQDDQVQIEASSEGVLKSIRFETSSRKEITLLGSDSTGSGDVDKRVMFAPEECMIEKWKLSTQSWQSVAEWFADLSRYSYQEDSGMNAVVEDVKKRAATPEEIASMLYDYVQKAFVYTGVEVGIGGYKPRFTSQTFQKKYGDCKDLSFLYVMLLRKAGIEAFPALVDTRSSKFFYKDFPTPTQFNHCVAFLPGIRNGTWVDSTVKNFRLGEIPSVIQGHSALVIGPNELREIPLSFEQSNVIKLVMNGTLGEKEMKAEGSIDTSGLTSMLIDIMKNALMQNTVKHYVYNTTLLPAAPVQKLQTSVSGDRALHVSFETPVYAADSFRIFMINPINYPPLKHLAYEPQPGEYYATGFPIRLIAESTVDLAGHKLISAPMRASQRGEFVIYKIELTVEQGKLRYFSDVYFANGLLDNMEMQRYQQELRSLSALIQRVAVIQ